jgi:5-methylcytosine-specific restriction endonuclease McrA
MKVYLTKWRADNPGRNAELSAKWRKENDAHYRAARRVYKQNNPQIVRAGIVLYKQRKRAAGGERIKASELLSLYAERNGICGICDLFVPLEDVTWDHITPISKGGPHALSNLQPAHRVCNSIKGSRTLEDARQTIQKRKS